MTRIVIVEDDATILRGLADNLRYESYDVLTATDGETGDQLIRDKRPDLVVLDLMLPRSSGYEVCRRLRSSGVNTPILMLTARGEETDRILGLDLGADDYVTKPFSVLEVLARVRALLRRTGGLKNKVDELRFDDVVIDFRSYEAKKGARVIEMTRKEFSLLQVLASRAGEVVTREDLLADIWGYDSSTTTRTIDTHVASLRAKLEQNPSEPRRLQTIHGVGYKWVG